MKSTDPTTWTEQEQADLVTALQNITDACATVAKEMTVALDSLTDAVNAVEAAKVDQPATTEGAAS